MLWEVPKSELWEMSKSDGAGCHKDVSMATGLLTGIVVNVTGSVSVWHHGVNIPSCAQPAFTYNMAQPALSDTTVISF